MYREEKEGKKIELMHNNYTIAVSFEGSKAVYTRRECLFFHKPEIECFAERLQSRAVIQVDVHSFANMVCEADDLTDLFVIYSAAETQCQNEPMFWSNDDVWASVGSHTIFSRKEKEMLNLPATGQWLALNGKAKESRADGNAD